MCGFVFVKYRYSKNNKLHNNFFEKECNNFIRSRGPSYQEIYKSNAMFIYQSTLAIQSNSIKSSNLSSIGSKKFILYNGEIYNFSKEKYNSDTEFLSYLSRIEILENELSEIDGMYAIGEFLRINNDQIICNAFRDPVGEKHLWYYFGEDIFILSSVPAIIRKYLNNKSNLSINKEAIDDYLKRRHLISPVEHPIKNISNLKPGHKLFFKSDLWFLTETQYFQYDSFFSKDLYVYLSKISQKEYNSEFNKIFGETLESMEYAAAKDIKSSCIVSGGLDSSIVGGHFLNKDQNINIYTMTFGAKDPVSKSVKNILSNKYENKNISHKVIECNLDSYKKSLLRSIDILSSPVNTHSIPSSYIVARNSKSDDNLILYGGEGADEIFLGYECYRNLNNQFSDYNGITQKFAFDKDLNQRVFSGNTENYINNFKESIKEFLISQNVFDPSQLNIKVESFVDIFIQLNNVGLMSTDTVNSDLGIECRTPFVRKKLMKFAISSPITKLINFDPKFRANKVPIREKFIDYFGEKSIMPKIGFAGFPNETKAYLGDKKNWRIWEFLGWKDYINFNLDQSEEWKIINLEWFLREIYT